MNLLTAEAIRLIDEGMDPGFLLEAVKLTINRRYTSASSNNYPVSYQTEGTAQEGEVWQLLHAQRY
jgi:hypothetical protein